MQNNINTLMIFAAGLGSRMKSITENLPKCLIQFQGKTFLEYALEFALTHNFTKVIINTHYLPNLINDAVKKFQTNHLNCPPIQMIHEELRLETGGGLKNALKYVEGETIFTLNSDIIIQADNINIFHAMEQFWDPSKMDILLFLQKYQDAVGYRGNGDFNLSSDNRLYIPSNDFTKEYMFSGLQIISRKLIENNPKQIFSLSEYYRNNETRLYGIYLPHKWFHANTPEDLQIIETSLRLL